MKYVTIGSEQLSVDNWIPPKNYRFVKPLGGLWASTYTPNEMYISAWHEFCIGENFNLDRLNVAVTFELINTAKIYTIDKLSDLTWLMNCYKNPDSLMFFDTLDFERLSKDYDVIHLTEEGQWRTRLSDVNLYGWDVESLLILNFDVITNQETISVKENEKTC